MSNWLPYVDPGGVPWQTEPERLPDPRRTPEDSLQQAVEARTSREMEAAGYPEKGWVCALHAAEWAYAEGIDLGEAVAEAWYIVNQAGYDIAPSEAAKMARRFRAGG